MADCIFCDMIERKLPAKIVFEDETTVALEDINPQAPVHLLVLPRKHLASLGEMKPADEAVVGHLMAVAAHLARERGLEAGYRTVINSGAGAGQSVFHLHAHLLAGRTFHWPPG
ncbi:MAG: histidine triad nucleotide-binding protein [Terriglobia bacterium]